jgi:hypothetical protein
MSITTIKTPVHLWIVGGLSLVWNAFGAFDFLMTQAQSGAYMAQFTQEQLTYFYGFPAWADGAWALGVWGSVFGSIGILVRRRWATWAFGVSIVGLVGTTLYTMVLTNGTAIMGGVGSLIFSAIIWALTIALFVYARNMAAQGVLR